MKNYKSKFDFNRPFKLIQSKSQFDQIKSTTFLFSTHQRQQAIPQHKKKQQIAVPNIQIIERITHKKSFAKITPNYIRISSALNLPKENQYELTQIDFCYLNSHNKNLFVLQNQNVLTEEFLKNCIIELQKQAFQLTKLPQNSGWLRHFIQRQYPQLIKMHNLQCLVNSIYNYWRNRRQQLKFPLYRLYWREDPYNTNNLKPFKRRVIPKRSLRKFAQIDEEQIIQQLLSQFNNTILICNRIQTRQNLKLKNIQLQIISFHQECKEYFKNTEEWKQQFQISPINRQKDRQNIKSLKHQVEQYKNNRFFSKSNQDTNQIIKSPFPLNKSLTLTNFLATVIYQAEQLGISYETIFQNQKKSQNLCIENDFKNDNQIQLNQVDYHKKPTINYHSVQQQNVSQQNISISIQKCRDLIIRSFENEQDENDEMNIADTLLQFRRKRLAEYYFGDDDDIGQYKDLRKNINNSFKRYLQLTNNFTFIPNK